MATLYYERPDCNSLQHHGILGQKWGVRRFQNPDGTLTAAGKERYGEDSLTRKVSNEDSINNKSLAASTKERKHLTEGQKKAIKIGIAVTATAAITAGAVIAYKKSPAVRNAVNSSLSKLKNVKTKDLTKDAEYAKLIKDADNQLAQIAKFNKEFDRIDASGMSNVGKINAWDRAYENSFGKGFGEINTFENIKNIFEKKNFKTGPIKSEYELFNNIDKYEDYATGKNNCTIVSTSYIFNKLGVHNIAQPNIDPVSGMVTGKPHSLEEIQRAFNGSVLHKTKFNGPGQLRKELLEKFPEGSKGILGSYKDKNGHAISWEIINGNVKLSDVQKPNSKIKNIMKVMHVDESTAREIASKAYTDLPDKYLSEIYSIGKQCDILRLDTTTEIVEEFVKGIISAK